MSIHTIVVFRHSDFKRLCHHLHECLSKESMAMAIIAKSVSADRTKLLVREVRIPEESDYLDRSAGAVSLRPEFLESCFQVCEQSNCHLLDVHTHPWSSKPQFSQIDDTEALDVKVPYLREWLPRTEIAFLLFGDKPDKIKGRWWNTSEERLLSVDAVHVL